MLFSVLDTGSRCSCSVLNRCDPNHLAPCGHHPARLVGTTSCRDRLAELGHPQPALPPPAEKLPGGGWAPRLAGLAPRRAAPARPRRPLCHGRLPGREPAGLGRPGRLPHPSAAGARPGWGRHPGTQAVHRRRHRAQAGGATARLRRRSTLRHRGARVVVCGPGTSSLRTTQSDGLPPTAALPIDSGLQAAPGALRRPLPPPPPSSRHSTASRHSTLLCLRAPSTHCRPDLFPPGA